MSTPWRNVVLIAKEPAGGFKLGDRVRLTVAFPANITREQVSNYVAADKKSFPLEYGIYGVPSGHPANAPLILCEERYAGAAAVAPTIIVDTSPPAKPARVNIGDESEEDDEKSNDDFGG